MPGSFLAFGVGIVPVLELAEPTKAWLDAFDEALAPYKSGRYLNFREESTEVSEAFPAETLARLRGLRERWDPAGLFRSSHPIAA